MFFLFDLSTYKVAKMKKKGGKGRKNKGRKEFGETEKEGEKIEQERLGRENKEFIRIYENYLQFARVPGLNSICLEARPQ